VIKIETTTVGKNINQMLQYRNGH